MGGAKLLGSPAAVRLFHDIGWGQWFRYVTGVVDPTWALLLVAPRLTGASALLLMTVMVVATGIELFVLHRPLVAATACPCAHGNHRVEPAGTNAATVCAQTASVASSSSRGVTCEAGVLQAAASERQTPTAASSLWERTFDDAEGRKGGYDPRHS